MAAQERAKPKDHYEVLGLSRDDAKSEVRSPARRRKMWNRSMASKPPFLTLGTSCS